jgi:hypothetical protein
MKITLSILFLFVVISFAGFEVKAQKTMCTVADPTGTRLNVREYGTSDLSNNRIVGKLRNGTLVRVDDYVKDPASGKIWAKISVYRNRKYVRLGYVFAEYLDCD